MNECQNGLLSGKCHLNPDPTKPAHKVIFSSKKR